MSARERREAVQVTRAKRVGRRNRNTASSTPPPPPPPPPPASDNARARASHYRKSVVSIRLQATTIAALDEEAKRATRDQDYRGGGWYSWRKVTRSDVIERAVKAWLDGAKGRAS